MLPWQAMDVPPQILEVAGRFRIPGRVTGVDPFPGGHINDSFLLEAVEERGVKRFLLQRINGRVFPDPAAILRNVQRVSAHLERELRAQETPDWQRRLLRLLPSIDGPPWWVDESGDFWRVYSFIDGSCSRTRISGPEDAAHAGRAFGDFQRRLAKLPPPPLETVLPSFHDTPARLAALEEAARADPLGRAAECGEELAQARAFAPEAVRIQAGIRSGSLPLRPVHNDCKISNVLFDRESGEALCVVDLDTVMPGSVLHDFGDMMRSMSTRAAEDETDLDRVHVDLGCFESLVHGYREGVKDLLRPAEWKLLVHAGLSITTELAARFLCDHLLGDHYFRIHRPGHNLDRARNQFALARSFAAHRGELEECVRRALTPFRRHGN